MLASAGSEAPIEIDGGISLANAGAVVAAGASILVAGVNFGCGSSREHAPQSLRKYGFNGVIAESFAEIFYGNSTTLAMPCVMVSPADIVAIRDTRALVLAQVDRTGGRVRIGGEEWSARAFLDGETMEPGEHVEVVQIEGATALVL